jgi:hypothetical protein
MRTGTRIAVLGSVVLLPWCLRASPPAGPAPAPASRPAGLPIALDDRSRMLMIGQPAAPVMPELFVFDGKKTFPAPAHVVAPGAIRVGSFKGKYPVPAAAGLSGAVAKKMWAIYAGATLDASQVDRLKMKDLAMWQILSSQGEMLVAAAVSLAEESKFYISPQYVVYAFENRKIAENGPFVTVLFPSGGSGVTLSRGGVKVEAGRSEDRGAVSYRLTKVKAAELLEWEIVVGQPGKGAFCPILLSAEEGFVEYTVMPPAERPASAPAPAPK